MSITLFLIHCLFNCTPVTDTVPVFRQQVIDSSISIGYGLALGDVDGDRRPDILLADKTQVVWYRNGDWKRFVMVDKLTKFDNVCIAAADLNGDGKVEVAVGAQWNPGETTDTTRSGSVHYLVRPTDPTARWTPITLTHEPTVHRMRWIHDGKGMSYLLVLPLHGRGNKDGMGSPARFLAYKYPATPSSTWETMVIDSSFHLTHNFDIYTAKDTSLVLLGGKEGLKYIYPFYGKGNQGNMVAPKGVGEVRRGCAGPNTFFIATIEPMHGTDVVIYTGTESARRIVIDDRLKEGHALATADILGLGRDQVIAGWRQPDSNGKTGIRIYVPRNGSMMDWDTHWVDQNGIATEDLQVMDMNGDGRPDIIASGRATKNLKIYWNENKFPARR